MMIVGAGNVRLPMSGRGRVLRKRVLILRSHSNFCSSFDCVIGLVNMATVAIGNQCFVTLFGVSIHFTLVVSVLWRSLADFHFVRSGTDIGKMMMLFRPGSVEN